MGVDYPDDGLPELPGMELDPVTRIIVNCDLDRPDDVVVDDIAAAVIDEHFGVVIDAFRAYVTADIRCLRRRVAVGMLAREMEREDAVAVCEACGTPCEECAAELAGAVDDAGASTG